ncbi:MAG: tyrosine-type recombinase/integrase, partial [Prolixibacteraceae bacterium]|nr:tyrosine-type recombinase/integrase [Prolixibacteraceae bacterium]
ETPVLMMVNFGHYEIDKSGKKRYRPLKYGTGEKIKPDFWNGKRAKQTLQFEYRNFNTRLENLESYAKLAIQEILNKGTTPGLQKVKELIDKKNPNIVEKKPLADNLNSYIDLFIKEIESGIRLSSKKQKYSSGTIKNFKGFQSQFDEYQKQKRKHLDFHLINLDFYDDYVEFFIRKNYSPNTIGRHIKNLKTIMHYSRDEGLHNNTEVDRKKFKILKEEVYNIYLNEKELKRMLELDLSEKPVLEIARDVFLIGCYTALRFSEYSQIREENITTYENASKVIRFYQDKTDEFVIIPIKPELEILLKKYNWNVPKIWAQKLNDHIKIVGEKAKINEIILIKKTKGGLKIKINVSKYKLIKSHTARRSGCTNMYLRGIYPIDIMKISGHKTEREFLKYIKITKEENAKNLINHPYFSSTQLKIAK